MRNKKKWGALVLSVIMVAALTLTGCRREREKIQVGETEPTTIVSTESESESESETSTEKTSETNTEKSSESETQSTDSNNHTESGSSDNTTGSSTSNTNTGSGTTTNNSSGTSTGNGTGGSTGSGGSSDNNTGSTGGDSNTGDNNDDGNGDSDEGDNTTVTTEAPRYFYDASGNRVDVSQLPDGSWQDSNGTSYTFYENGVQDSNGNQYYYDPPALGNTSVDVGTQADFYDTQGNHIVCVMDENGNWVDNEGNVYVFGEDGVTDSNGNFHPY